MTSDRTHKASRLAQDLYIGDALDMLTTLPSASVDAVITDPPYAIKRLSSVTARRPVTPRADCPKPECSSSNVCVECFRAAAVARFAESPMLGRQSQNWHAKETHSRGYADNDPHEFQQWCRLWLDECLRVLKPGGHLVAFGGTRTWHRLATAVEDSGFEIRDSLAWLYSSGMPKSLNVDRALAKAGNQEARTTWAGCGTALKPAFEPIVLGRKPLQGTMVQNVAAWGVGPLRLAPSPSRTGNSTTEDGAAAKWPSNVHMDSAQAQALAAISGQYPAHYFWVSKPNQKERVVVDGVSHPTVKPLDLMTHLVRLVTPPGGTVLDPFAGSGTTLEASLMEGRGFIGIERDIAYVPLIEARIARRTAFESAPAPSNSEQPRLF